MSTESAIAPLDPELFDQILADHEDAYAKQSYLLKVAAIVIVALIVGNCASLGVAYFAITKERDHPYVMAEDHVTGERSLVAPAESVQTMEGRHAAADVYIRAAFEVTEDDAYNLRLRGEAIEKMNASREDKELYMKRATAILEEARGYVHTIESIEYFPPPERDPTGLKWDAKIVVKVQDLREGITSHDPIKLKKFMLPIIMKEVPPRAEKPRNLAGLLFLPVAPREEKEKPDAQRR